MKSIVKRRKIWLLLFLFVGLGLWAVHGQKTEAAIVSTNHQKYTYVEYRKD